MTLVAERECDGQPLGGLSLWLVELPVTIDPTYVVHVMVRRLLVAGPMKFTYVLLLAAALPSAACTSEGISEQSLTQPVGECGETEIHVFGVYTAPEGEVTVRINRPGKHAIALTGHDAVKWRIVTGPESEVVGVYTVGIDKQTLMNPPNGAGLADDHSKDGGPGGCAYSYPDSKPGCRTEDLLRLVDKTVGHEATSFHGCFAATQFTMAADLAVTSDCAEHSDGRPMAEFVTNCNGPDSCGGIVL